MLHRQVVGPGRLLVLFAETKSTAYGTNPLQMSRQKDNEMEQATSNQNAKDPERQFQTSAGGTTPSGTFGDSSLSEGAFTGNGGRFPRPHGRESTAPASTLRKAAALPSRFITARPTPSGATTSEKMASMPSSSS